MSSLMVLTEPALQNAYLLAGADVYVAETPAQAEAHLARWIAEDVRSLIAIHEQLYEGLSPAILQRVKASQLFLVVVPGPQTYSQPEYWQQRVQEMIRESIGVHITFKEKQ